MNVNLLEKGDRRTLIKTSCSSGLLSQGNISNLIDGSKSDSAWFIKNNNDAWIKFKFPRKVGIEKIIWYQDKQIENGIWF